MAVPAVIAEAVQTFTTWVIPLLLAMTLHEAGHAFAAYALGDDGVMHDGRLSLNPKDHIDPVGTLLLPMLMLLSGARLMIGWAKPVMVNFGRLKPQRLGGILVSLAGPGTNFLLAVISAAAYFHLSDYVPEAGHDWAVRNLINSVSCNLSLMVFNLLPIPPLDGGRVVAGLLPRYWAWKFEQLERYSQLILLGLIFILPMLHIDILRILIGIPVMLLTELLSSLLGP